MKVADFVINYFGDKGIKDIFEVYGAANGDLIDAFTRTDKTRYVAVMHEQSAGFAAECYAKISGKPAVSIATSGPGGQNFVTPIANCFYDSVPAIFLTGQVNSNFLRPDKSIRQRGFQETPIVEIVNPVTKYAKLVTDPNSIKYELEKAWFISQDGRPGPVLLDLPIDVQKAEIDPDSLTGFNSTTFKTTFDLNPVDVQIKNYLEDLAKSERPVILVGAGVRHSKGIESLLELGNKLKIPMFPTWNALDVVTSDNEHYGGRVGTYGGKGRNFGLQNSDLVLAIGSRISGRLYGSQTKAFLREAKKYVVDIDNSNLQQKFQEVPFDENVFCDAKVFTKKLNEALGDLPQKDFSKWTEKVMGWRDKYDPVKPEFFNQSKSLNPYAFFRVLSQEMEKGDTLVGDCGGNIVLASQAFETKEDQRFITNNGNSPMGFSFAGAMGAYLASDKGKNVVCTIGDGGFNMNLQELQTLKNYNLNFKTFLINNQIYGITKAFQEKKFEGRSEACGPKGYTSPDLIKICDAYGVKTDSIDGNDIDNMREKIKKVLDFDGPMVCEVNCPDWHLYEPTVFGAVPIEDMHPKLPREEFEANMIIEPWKNKETNSSELP
ncbi:thiamine pyrophosphate-binding protein [archaeon]|jgi:acetolactate synthase I/II/III large subunit|nr:thiamine pyrophosphate-binding protein [archaeon]